MWSTERVGNFQTGCVKFPLCPFLLGGELENARDVMLHSMPDYKEGSKEHQ